MSVICLNIIIFCPEKNLGCGLSEEDHTVIFIIDEDIFNIYPLPYSGRYIIQMGTLNGSPKIIPSTIYMC